MHKSRLFIIAIFIKFNFDLFPSGFLKKENHKICEIKVWWIVLICNKGMMSEEHSFIKGMGTRQQNYEPISVLTSDMSFILHAATLALPPVFQFVVYLFF